MRKLFKCMIKPYNWILNIHRLTLIKVEKIYIYDIGSALDDLKRYGEAIQIFDKAIQLNPQYSFAYINKGWKNIYIWYRKFIL